MPDYQGLLVLKLDQTEALGFLNFTFTRGSKTDVKIYRLTASLTDDVSKEWRCDVVMGSHNGSVIDDDARSLQQFKAVLMTKTPFVEFSSERKFSKGSRFFLSIFLYDYEPTRIYGDWSKPTVGYAADFEDKKTQFTDEAEAKELNAKCKIRFEDSDKVAFVNPSFLTMYSTVFRDMFEGDSKENKEVKLEVNRDDFLSFLDCLYLPPAPITMDNFKAVAMTAHLYKCAYLLKNCKVFAAKKAEEVSTIGECKDFIEVAERLGWQQVMMAVLDSMKKQSAIFLVELLDSEWMMARHWHTRSTIFSEIKQVICLPALQHTVVRPRCERKCKDMNKRFTDEDEAKELDANCTIRFVNSEKIIYVNRHLLSMYSKVFRAMFRDECKDATEITLDVRPGHFICFLYCLYFPTSQVNTYNFKTVLMIAKRYDCPQLFEECKEFAEKEASKATTVEDCANYIEVAEFLGWNNLAVIDSMKDKGIDIFIELFNLNWFNNKKRPSWIKQRNPSTQRALFAGLKEVILSHVK